MGAGLDKPTSFDLNFDGIKNTIANLTDPSKISLAQIISGMKAVLTMIEAGIKDDLLTKMPLVGDNVDLDKSFIGNLRKMIDRLDSVISTEVVRSKPCARKCSNPFLTHSVQTA